MGSQWARLLRSAQVNSSALNHLFKLILLSAVFPLFAQPFLWRFAKVFTSQLAKRSTFPQKKQKQRKNTQNTCSGKQRHNEKRAASGFEKRSLLKADQLQWQHLGLPSTSLKDDKKPKLLLLMETNCLGQGRPADQWLRLSPSAIVFLSAQPAETRGSLSQDLWPLVAGLSSRNFRKLDPFCRHAPPSQRGFAGRCGWISVRCSCLFRPC